MIYVTMRLPAAKGRVVPFVVVGRGGRFYPAIMTHRFAIVLPLALTLAACAQMPDFLSPRGGSDDVLEPAADNAPPPPPEEIAAIVAAPPPPRAARTADALDTTTAEQKAAATALPAEGEETRLGETVASLGDPTEPGLWIRTPLADAPGSGRVENPATGKSAVVQLIPREGAVTAGSQASLATLRLLEAPLTDLTTLIVFAN